jgi:thiol-disulfide isomerase/thioredoxin
MKRDLYSFTQLLIITFCLALLGACSPKADFYYSDGSAGTYKSFEGKWLLINYWAEWCKPCIKEIPELNAFASSNDHVQVIGINYDHLESEKEQAIIKQLNIQFPVAQAPLHEHFLYDLPRSLPSTVVITPEGKIKTILLGPQTIDSLEKVTHL